MTARRPSIGVVLVTGALAALVLFALWGSVEAWRLAGPVHMSIHGYIAMAIGVVGTLALAGGLIWLAYYSARAGYDDDSHEP